jgi:hypothetical protein
MSDTFPDDPLFGDDNIMFADEMIDDDDEELYS